MRTIVVIVAILIIVILSPQLQIILADDTTDWDNYIIVLKDNVTNTEQVYKEFSMKYDIKKIEDYEFVFNGISAVIPPDKIGLLAGDSRVESVEQDALVRTSQITEVLPTGVDRIDAEPDLHVSHNINADIAIIDTGIDLDHPDLNVVSEISFVKGTKSGDDDNGHGTQVAGIAAALDNDIGVVGVAPGARLHAVKVLDSAGLGSISKVIKGLDWVAKNAKTIDVANLSLECSCHSKALHKAIQRVVNKGVAIAVAAGNDASDASNFEPAAYPEVITVSAIVDTDGKCGSLGIGTEYGSDDSFASFSNRGSMVDVAAPGVQVLTTNNNKGYVIATGTSMASPHVSGAAALYLQDKSRDLNNDGSVDSRDVDALKHALLLTAVDQDKPCITSAEDGNGGFSGDVDGFREPLIYVKQRS